MTNTSSIPDEEKRYRMLEAKLETVESKFAEWRGKPKENTLLEKKKVANKADGITNPNGVWIKEFYLPAREILDAVEKHIAEAAEKRHDLDAHVVDLGVRAAEVLQEYSLEEGERVAAYYEGEVKKYRDLRTTASNAYHPPAFVASKM